jgi:hypothetical protein
MRGLAVVALLAVALHSPLSSGNGPGAIANPAIDSAGYLETAVDAAKHRAARRVTEDEFVRLARLPGTVVLDARSKPRFDALHVKGAVNLDFADITVDSLAQLVPDKTTRILIYCNNNFLNAPDFPTKIARTSLNLSTYQTLYAYGYRNVYELGPLLDARTTRIAFEGTYVRHLHQ